jgi:hypothetical protein
MHFSRAKKQLFARVYGKGKATLYCEKKSKQGLKSIRCVRDLLSMTLYSAPKTKI